jgi:hypothetical protein
MSGLAVRALAGRNGEGTRQSPQCSLLCGATAHLAELFAEGRKDPEVLPSLCYRV